MEEIKKLKKALKRWDRDIYDDGDWDDIVNESHFSSTATRDYWIDHACFPWFESRLKDKTACEYIEHISPRCPEKETASDGLVICRRYYFKRPEINRRGRWYSDDHYKKRYYIHEVGKCPQCDYKERLPVRWCVTTT